MEQIIFFGDEEKGMDNMEKRIISFVLPIISIILISFVPIISVSADVTPYFY